MAFMPSDWLHLVSLLTVQAYSGLFRWQATVAHQVQQLHFEARK
jgi:hypothetical protein